MRLQSSGQSVRVIPLVAMVFLLCLMAYPRLNTFPTDVEGPTVEHISHMVSGSPGDGHVLVGSHLLALAEEMETEEEQPLNAEFLTALLFSVALLGIALGLLLRGKLILRRGALLPLLERSLHSFYCISPREPAVSLFSVFRL